MLVIEVPAKAAATCISALDTISSFPCFTACSRLLLIALNACKAAPSQRGWKPVAGKFFGTGGTSNASNAWVTASIPVHAVMFGDKSIVSSGSNIAVTV